MGERPQKDEGTGHSVPVPVKIVSLAFGDNRWRGFALADVLRDIRAKNLSQINVAPAHLVSDIRNGPL